MLSSQNITKLTVVGLAVAAIAAPAASATGRAPAQASQQRLGQTNYLAQAHRLKAGKTGLFYRNVSARQLAAELAPPPVYSPQDKQVVANASPQAPATAPIAVRHADPGGGNDWEYAGLGAGGAIVVVLLGVGGPFALERRTRRAAKGAAIAIG